MERVVWLARRGSILDEEATAILHATLQLGEEGATLVMVPDLPTKAAPISRTLHVLGQKVHKACSAPQTRTVVRLQQGESCWERSSGELTRMWQSHPGGGTQQCLAYHVSMCLKPLPCYCYSDPLHKAIVIMVKHREWIVQPFLLCKTWLHYCDRPPNIGEPISMKHGDR